MSEKYFTCTVKISKDSIKEFLSQFYDENEVEEMNDWQLQSETTESLNGILGDHFSDYWVLDEDSIVIGDL